jgi:hypothetical protein
VVEADGSYDDFPKDARVSAFHLRGGKEREGAMLVESDSGSSAVFCDAVMNVPPRGGLMGFALAPTGRPSVPRAQRWLVVSDRASFRGHLEEMASVPNLARVLVGHGSTISENAAATLRDVASELS